MKLSIPILLLSAAFSVVAWAGEEPFKLSSQRPELPLKPSKVMNNLVEFEIEDKILKIYKGRKGKMTTSVISSAQIHNPSEAVVPKLKKYEAMRIAAAIFKKQEEKNRRRQRPRPLLGEREESLIKLLTEGAKKEVKVK